MPTLRTLARPLNLNFGSRVHRDGLSQGIMARECSRYGHLMLFNGKAPGVHTAPIYGWKTADKHRATSSYHCLFYPAQDPQWYRNLSVSDREREQHVRCAMIASKLEAQRSRGVMQVMNEIASWGLGSVKRNFAHYPEPNYHVKTFQIARQYFSRDRWRLAINEANTESDSETYSNRGTDKKSVNARGHWESYKRVIEELGDLVDVVGLQAHAGPGNQPGGRWEWNFEDRADWLHSQGLAWEITEHDWWGSIRTHDQWAALLEQIIPICVKYGCETFQTWGISDAQTWALDPKRPFYSPDNSPCLFDKDGNAKPIYAELVNIFKHLADEQAASDQRDYVPPKRSQPPQ